MYFGGYGDDARNAGFVVRRPLSLGVSTTAKLDADSGAARLDGLSDGTVMDYDEMCNPSSISSDLGNSASDAAILNTKNIFYFQFEEWKRPVWLYPVWVCRNSEAVCWPTIDPKDYSEKFTAPGMKDDDYNGIVDDGLCRWAANDVVKECQASTTETDTVEQKDDGTGDANKANKATCLRPTPEQIAASGSTCKDDSDNKNAVVLRWNVLPMYPFDRGTKPADFGETLLQVWNVGIPKKVTCKACSDIKFPITTPTQEKGEYHDGLSDADKRYCCSERDRFSNNAANPASIESTFNTEIANHLLDALTDFGPVDRSRAGGPIRDGLQRKKTNTDDPVSYYFGRKHKSDDEFPSIPYDFSANAEQKEVLLQAYKKFVEGPCSHPCSYINTTNLICPSRSCISDDPKTRKVACKQYTTSTMAGCYCEGALRDAKSVLDKFWSMVQLVYTIDPVCTTYYTSALQGTIISYLTLGLVIIINVALTRLLRKLAMIERPAHWLVGVRLRACGL